MSLSNDDIKQLINILQKALVTDDQQESDEDIVEQQPPPKEQFSTKSRKQKVANKETQHYNRFESMPEKGMHKDDTRIDKLLNQHSPTQRSREFEMIDVACRVCGRKESINSNLVYDGGNRYKCNRCARTPG